MCTGRDLVARVARTPACHMRKTLFPGQASIHATFEHSALRRNMPQRNDDEGGKSTRISFSPASLSPSPSLATCTPLLVGIETVHNSVTTDDTNVFHFFLVSVRARSQGTTKQSEVFLVRW